MAERVRLTFSTHAGEKGDERRRIRFFGNFFPDYHKTGDTCERIDPQQVERVARFAFPAAWEPANDQ